MSIVPIIRPAEMLRILLKAGFRIIRTKGSHIRLRHYLTGRETEVAMHPRDLLRGTTMAILKQAGISIKEFLRLLKK